MKKYRLLKDTPTAVAGTICTTPSDQEHIIVDPYGVEYDIAKIDNFDKWFNEVKEYKRWRAEKGERYWFIRPPLYIDSETELDSNFDDECWESGNYFKTKEEAESYCNYLVALQTIKDDTEEFEADWGDDSQRKWLGYYDHEYGELRAEYSEDCQHQGAIYFASQKDIEASFKKHRKEWLQVLGVDNEEV